MAELIADCPRCHVKRTTFSILNHDGNNSYSYNELFCKCHHCYKTVVFSVAPISNGVRESINSNRLINLTQSISEVSVVTVQPNGIIPPPEHLPEDIMVCFNEGAQCYSIGCYNAAATMFRLCLDKATKSFLPEDPMAPPVAKIRRSLGFRMDWLFENNILPSALKGLAECIKDDGNDGAHEGILSKVDVDDLIDFTITLLERLYTEPKKIELANQRRLERRQQ